MSLFSFGIRVIMLTFIGLVRKCSFRLYFLGEIAETWYHFSFKCLAELTGETVWAWCFTFYKVLNWFSFFMDIGPVRWPTFLGWILVGIVPFCVSYSICGHRVVHNLLLSSLKSMGSVAMAPLSFLIVVSCVSSFFPHIVQLDIYQLYCNFQRTSLEYGIFSSCYSLEP